MTDREYREIVTGALMISGLTFLLGVMTGMAVMLALCAVAGVAVL